MKVLLRKRKVQKEKMSKYLPVATRMYILSLFARNVGTSAECTA